MKSLLLLSILLTTSVSAADLECGDYTTNVRLDELNGMVRFGVLSHIYNGANLGCAGFTDVEGIKNGDGEIKCVGLQSAAAESTDPVVHVKIKKEDDGVVRARVTGEGLHQRNSKKDTLVLECRDIL